MIMKNDWLVHVSRVALYIICITIKKCLKVL